MYVSAGESKGTCRIAETMPWSWETTVSFSAVDSCDHTSSKTHFDPFGNDIIDRGRILHVLRGVNSNDWGNRNERWVLLNVLNSKSFADSNMLAVAHNCGSPVWQVNLDCFVVAIP
jgi:hypothetical protein